MLLASLFLVERWGAISGADHLNQMPAAPEEPREYISLAMLKV